jgi:dolichol-phosphate mannosyltransferase
VRGIRLSRNFGSHLALLAGLRIVKGDAAIDLSADMQEPPELIIQMVQKWRAGAQVVWAQRRDRGIESIANGIFSRMYYIVMRNLVGIRQLPSKGADTFLLDRVVLNALSQFNERNISLFNLIVWMGFKQDHIEYDKQPRVIGTSNWNFTRKFNLVVDSVVQFSYFPIRVMTILGAVIAFFGFLYAAVAFYVGLRGGVIEGWASTMVVILVLGGVQMLMLGVLGEYLWRTLEESRRRPVYLIEAVVGKSNNATDSPAQIDQAVRDISSINLNR